MTTAVLDHTVVIFPSDIHGNTFILNSLDDNAPLHYIQKWTCP